MLFLRKELLSIYAEQAANRKNNRQSTKERMAQRRAEADQIKESYFKKTDTLNRLRNK